VNCAFNYDGVEEVSSANTSPGIILAIIFPIEIALLKIVVAVTLYKFIIIFDLTSVSPNQAFEI